MRAITLNAADCLGQLMSVIGTSRPSRMSAVTAAFGSEPTSGQGDQNDASDRSPTSTNQFCLNAQRKWVRADRGGTVSYRARSARNFIAAKVRLNADVLQKGLDD